MTLLSLDAEAVGSEITQEEVGAFVVETEHWTRDGPPIMHSANETKHVRLLWTSSDGNVEAKLEDDGYGVRINYILEFSAQDGCVSRGGLLEVIDGPSDGIFWVYQIESFDELAKRCSELSDSGIARYQSEMLEALPDAPAAIELWKERSTEMFSSRRRCLAEEMTGNSPPAPFWRCTHWSASPPAPFWRCTHWSAPLAR
ncbi:hypothetical protein D6201_02735 [Aurantiacibacter aquimixticola]|uniref:Uncharacterized protein n=1 Tax=Aurantiacibacter aquimixticola TaxID=1958945 RepID=A0A419RRL3_9SPHN|nr:hypothetical protein D6201_02735 [Aurantiacibacter aquimixticola]